MGKFKTKSDLATVRAEVAAQQELQLASEPSGGAVEQFLRTVRPLADYTDRRGGISGLSAAGWGLMALLAVGALLLLYKILQVLRDDRPAQLAAPPQQLLLPSGLGAPPVLGQTPQVIVIQAAAEAKPAGAGAGAGFPLPSGHNGYSSTPLAIGELQQIMQESTVFRRVVVSATQAVIISNDPAGLRLPQPDGQLLIRHLPTDLGVVHPTQKLYAINVSGCAPAVVTVMQQPLTLSA